MRFITSYPTYAVTFAFLSFTNITFANLTIEIYNLEGQPLEMVNELSVYILKMLIQEKVVTQKTMKEIKQLLGTTDQKSIRELTHVKILFYSRLSCSHYTYTFN